MNKNILILGAGSWGATIANMLSDKRFKVNLWEFNPEQARYLDSTRRLPVLPALKIHTDIRIDFELANLIEQDQTVIIAVPSLYFRSAVQGLKKHQNHYTRPVISLTKGIEQNTLKRMSEIVIEEIPHIAEYVAVVSGPSHAEEVLNRIPSAVVCAAYSEKIAHEVQSIFFNKSFRVYTQKDIIGVELGGALKNIYAIGAGICDGMRLGDNTKAAFITRGIAEIVRLGKALGAKETTFAGLSGIGDLMVTCFSIHSRNRLLGEKIGSGKTVTEALREMTMVAEGYPTAKSAHQMGLKIKMELPIINEIYKTLYENKLPYETVDALMGRSAKDEMADIESYLLGGGK